MPYRTILTFLGFVATIIGAAGSPSAALAETSEETTVVEAGIEVTSDNLPFQFYAVDVYSSMTPIPYRFIGFLDSQVVFDVIGTEPNTFGSFATVENPEEAEFIDTLEIILTNDCPLSGNPMGLDNIVVLGSSPDNSETIDFTGLTIGSPFVDYFQGEFTVTSLFGDWLVSGYGNPSPAIIFYNPYPVGGSITGLTPQWVRCRNMTTRQTVTIQQPGTVWDCEAEGLVVTSGDRVRMTVQGTAD